MIKISLSKLKLIFFGKFFLTNLFQINFKLHSAISPLAAAVNLHFCRIYLIARLFAVICREMRMMFSLSKSSYKRAKNNNKNEAITNVEELLSHIP